MYSSTSDVCDLTDVCTVFSFFRLNMSLSFEELCKLAKVRWNRAIEAEAEIERRDSSDEGLWRK